uniref:Uncharacterized protein n=1 Tax=Oryza nivara TaxID=4536 RepID=A0A0E0HJA1_ORYNI
MVEEEAAGGNDAPAGNSQRMGFPFQCRSPSSHPGAQRLRASTAAHGDLDRKTSHNTATAAGSEHGNDSGTLVIEVDEVVGPAEILVDKANSNASYAKDVSSPIENKKPFSLSISYKRLDTSP